MSLSASELAQMRADQVAYQPDTCTIQTLTRVMDGIGGWADTWADTYTSVTCRVAPLSAGDAERLVGAALASVTHWMVTVPHNQTLTAAMRVVHNGTTYETVGVEGLHSNLTAKRGYLRLVG